MAGQINRFEDLTVVRENEDAEGWIINSGYRSGLFGPEKAKFWQLMKDGTLRLGDSAARTFFASHKIGLEKPEELNVFAGKTALWIVPYDEAQGNAVVFDLNNARITARLPGLTCRKFGLGRVTPEGALIFQGYRRIDDVLLAS